MTRRGVIHVLLYTDGGGGGERAAESCEPAPAPGGEDSGEPASTPLGVGAQEAPPAGAELKAE